VRTIAIRSMSPQKRTEDLSHVYQLGLQPEDPHPKQFVLYHLINGHFSFVDLGHWLCMPENDN
jgi:hypothetical protein